MACMTIYRGDLVSLERTDSVTKRRRPRGRIRKAVRLRASALSRIDVTRAEYNRIVEVLNERSEIVKALRQALHDLRHDSDIQFKRIAQLQAELDRIVQALSRRKLLT